MQYAEVWGDSSSRTFRHARTDHDPSFSSRFKAPKPHLLSPPLRPPTLSLTSVVTRCPTNHASDLASTRPSLSRLASLASIAGLARQLDTKTRSRTGREVRSGVTTVLVAKVATRKVLLQLLRPRQQRKSMRPSMRRKASSMSMSHQFEQYGPRQPTCPPSIVLIYLTASKSDQRRGSEIAIGTSTRRRHLPTRR